MIKKAFNYYYLVLLRHYDNYGRKDWLFHNVPFVMALTLIINLYSLAALIFNYRIIEGDFLWIVLFILFPGTYLGLVVIYNKKRREELREKYKNESLESRRRGVAWVVVYEILSLAFLVLALSMLKRPLP